MLLLIEQVLFIETLFIVGLLMLEIFSVAAFIASISSESFTFFKFSISVSTLAFSSLLILSPNSDKVFSQL